MSDDTAIPHTCKVCGGAIQVAYWRGGVTYHLDCLPPDDPARLQRSHAMPVPITIAFDSRREIGIAYIDEAKLPEDWTHCVFSLAYTASVSKANEVQSLEDVHQAIARNPVGAKLVELSLIRDAAYVRYLCNEQPGLVPGIQSAELKPMDCAPKDKDILLHVGGSFAGVGVWCIARWDRELYAWRTQSGEPILGTADRWADLPRYVE